MSAVIVAAAALVVADALPETVVVMTVEVSPMAEVAVMTAAVEAFAVTGCLACVARPSFRK